MHGNIHILFFIISDMIFARECFRQRFLVILFSNWTKLVIVECLHRMRGLEISPI